MIFCMIMFVETALLLLPLTTAQWCAHALTVQPHKVSLFIFHWNKDDDGLVEFQNHKCFYSNTFSEYSNSYEFKSQNRTLLSGNGFYDQPKGPPGDHPEGGVNTDDATSSDILDKKSPESISSFIFIPKNI